MGEQLLLYRRTFKILLCYAAAGFAPSAVYVIRYSVMASDSQGEAYETDPYSYYGITGCLLIISFGLLFPNAWMLRQRQKTKIQMNANLDKYA